MQSSSNAHTSLQGIIKLSDLRSELEEYKIEKSFFESIPDFIENLEQLAQKNNLTNDDQLQILKILAEISERNYNDKTSCLYLIRRLTGHIGNEKILCARALVKKDLFTPTNISNIFQHPFLCKNIIYLYEKEIKSKNNTLLTQDSINLLVYSASRNNPETYLIKCTDHLCWMLYELGKHQLLDQDIYTILNEKIQDNLKEKIILENNRYSKDTNKEIRIYEWSKNISMSLIINACKNVGFDIEITNYNSDFQRRSSRTCGIRRDERGGKDNDNHLVYYLKSLKLMEQSGILNKENIDILFDHSYCFGKFVSVISACYENNLLNEKNFRELCSISKSVTEMYDMKPLIQELVKYKLFLQPVFDIILTAKSVVDIYISPYSDNRKEIYTWLEESTRKTLVNFIYSVRQYITADILEKLLRANRIKEADALFKIMSKCGFLNQSIFTDLINIIIDRDDVYISAFQLVIDELNKTGHLNPVYLIILLNQHERKDCLKMYLCFNHLVNKSILSLENLDDTLEYSQPSEKTNGRYSERYTIEFYINSLSVLSKCKILNSRTRKIIRYDPLSSIALLELEIHGELTDDIINIMLKEYERSPFIEIMTLHRTGLANKKNINAVLSHENPGSLNKAMEYLIDKRKVSQNILDDLFLSKQPLIALQIMDFLHALHLFNKSNHDLVIRHPNQFELCLVINLLLNYEFTITQTHLNNIFLYGHLLVDETTYCIFSEIPPYLFNEAVFNQLILICSLNAEDGVEAWERLREYVNQLINPGQRGQRLNQNNINNGQSTHTRSIHKSVSETAIKLNNLYGKQIDNPEDLMNVLQEIKTFINQLPSNLKNDAAKRAVNSLGKRLWEHKDPVSNVTNLQLLALAWLAIHDESKRFGNLDDAKLKFVEGLYEIQRGYNIDAPGLVDDGDEDRVICVGGTFNKIPEKMWGIHKDVELIFITKESAINKLPCLIKNTISEYLNITNLDISELESLYIKFQNDNNDEEVNTLWNEIRPAVYADMQEYDSVFRDKQEFVDFIDSGFYTIYTFMDELIRKINTIKQNNGVVVFKTETINIESEPAKIGNNIRKETIQNKILSPVIDVVAGSTYRLKRNTQQHIKRNTENSDVFSVVMMPNGLPIAIIIDGEYATNTRMQLSASLLMEQFQQFSALVEGQAINEDNLKNLAIKIFMAAEKNAQGKCDTASLALVVQFHNSKGVLQYLALGCGDCMVLHDNGKTVKTVIAAKNDYNKKPSLTFDACGSIKNHADLNIATGPATVGDRFLLMTDGAYENLELDVINNNDICTTNIRNPDIFLNKTPYDMAVLADKMADEKLRDIDCSTSGDDILIASVSVPSERQQAMLKTLCVAEPEKRSLLQSAAAKANLTKLNAEYTVLHNNKASDSLYQTLFGKTDLRDKRMEGWGALVTDLRLLQTNTDKLALIEYALSLDLFNKHRSDYIITGAFGNTYTVNMINELKDTLNKHSEGEQVEDEFEICSVANFPIAAGNSRNEI